LWIAVVGAFSWIEYNELIDPSITIEQDSLSITFEIGMLILMMFYFFWICYAICRACGLDNKKAFLKRRLRFFLIFSVVIIIIIGFGFLLEIYQRPNNAAEFLSFHSLANLYVFVLAVVYLPSSESQQLGYIRDLQITTLEDDEISLETSKEKNVDIEDGELELHSLSDDNSTTM